MKNFFLDEVILTTDNFIIAQDWEVPIPAFFILSTKRKIRSIAEFTEAEEFGPLNELPRPKGNGVSVTNHNFVNIGFLNLVTIQLSILRGCVLHPEGRSILFE